ncbi:MAG: hypothetical protein L3K03_02060, partial [Thermoplasmata archaeon]|nr:hypothetical protein [Thermoplasmata archaeon]
MALPGPGGALWAAELLLWAALYVPLGDLIRGIGARRIPLLRLEDPIERILVDLYLGGAVVYTVAAVPIGAWGPWTAWVLWIGGVAGWVAYYEWRRRAKEAPGVITAWSRLIRLPQLVVIAVTAGLFAVELSLAEAAASGNTFDSSVLATFTGLTQLHHQLPSNFSPVTAQAILYPQGSTAWLVALPGAFDVPGARLALLVTPLFLALVPLAAYVWGRRWFASDRAGAAFALTFALLASWTRLLFQGSNDFVFAFPLVLLLWAWMPLWTRPDPPLWGDALAYGLFAGYSAALNPVGAELLFPMLILVAVAATPRFSGRFFAWGVRWVGSLGVALVPVIPSLAVAWAGAASFALTPGALPPPPAPATIPVGSNLLGLLDPFLFQADDVRLSPLPGLRVELAVLLVVGLALLYVPGFLGRESPGWARLRRFLPSSFVVVAALAAASLGGGGVPGISRIASLTSPPEASLLLFSVFAAVAALPLVWLFEAASGGGSARPPEGVPVAAVPAYLRAPRSRERTQTLLCLVLAAALLVPGLALTVTQVPQYGTAVYNEFGNVTPQDYELLEWS